MSEPTIWSTLPKTVDDLTTIEEQIDADILVHNIDPSAHGQADEAIHDHRTEEEIDHPDSSISLKKLVQSKFLILSCLQSLDGWGLVGNASPGMIDARVYTTNVVNNESILYFETFHSGFVLNFAKNPFFQTSVWLLSVTGQNATWGCGTEKGNMDMDSFGFEVEGGVLYARWTKWPNEFRQVIGGITLTVPNVYRAEVDSANSKIYFYVNGVLKYTAAANFPDTNNNFFFTYWIKTTAAAVKSMYIIDFMFQQDR